MSMLLVRLIFAVYWSFLSFLLLVPEPVKLLGLQKTPVSSLNRGVHFSLFLVLALLASASRWPVRFGILVLVLVGYAGVTEGLQWFVPSRQVELLDLAENLLGLLAGLLPWQAILQGWQKVERRRMPFTIPIARAPDSNSDNS